MLFFTLLLTREFGWRNAVELGIGGAVLLGLFWRARGNMWNVVLVAIVITLLMLVYRMLREKKFIDRERDRDGC